MVMLDPFDTDVPVNPTEDVEAETLTLGAVLLHPEVMDRLWGHAEASWFTGRRAVLWTTLESLWADGDALRLNGRHGEWDLVTVRDRLHASTGMAPGEASEWLLALFAAGPARESVGAIESLKRHAYRRRLGRAGHELVEAARSHASLDELATTAERWTATLEVQAAATAGVWGNDFLATPDEADDPWIIPGMLRQGWRAMIVAGEGSGKSLLLRQTAVAAAIGVHPLQHGRIDPVNVLLVDLENSASSIRRSVRALADGADLARLRIVSQPGGIDLRRPRDRAMLDAELRTAKAQLMTIGPIYKSYVTVAGEQDERTAMEVQRHLDDLRTRHQCAVMLEHHAPHGDTLGRKLRPVGSSAWMRWPELGISMDPDRDRHPGSMTLGRFRGDRSSNSWPQRLDRGNRWPWVGRWDDNPGDMT